MIKKAKSNVITSTNIIEDRPALVQFPIDVFPTELQNFIIEVSEGTGFSKDFLSVSIMSAFASIYGMKFYTEVTNTWISTPIFWFSLVGTPGTKKSHPLKLAMKAVDKIDIHNKTIYDQQMEQFEIYKDMDDKDRKAFNEMHGVMPKPNFKQLIVDDATIEALFYVHNINKNGILLYKDELIGWIKGMGQYKGGKGDEMEKYLSMFDGGALKKNRVAQEPLMLSVTNMNVIGTVQPEVLAQIPKDNGFLYRFLFTNADREIKRASRKDVDKLVLDKYTNKIRAVYEAVQNSGNEQILYEMTGPAKDVRVSTENYLVDVQTSESTEPIILSYCEKLKTYSPRFGLLLALIRDSYATSQNIEEVTASDMNKAKQLVDYFLSTASNLFFDRQKTKEVADISNTLYGKTIQEKIILLHLRKISAKDIAKEVEKSIQYVYRIVKEYKKGSK